MNFFERQRAARGTTAKLVVLFVLAVVAIVLVIDALVFFWFRKASGASLITYLLVATGFTLAVIAGGTLSKLVALRAGGAAVAQSVGAIAVDPTTRDPRLRRFVNIVEEMSIASGVPVPRLFVLEREPGINAFAAGYSPSDAAITVTSGALDTLNRDELQGVIGHEFSHVLNGDMRLNVRLIGLLNGILLLGLIGLRFLQFGGGRSRDSKGSPLLVIAIALMVLGFVGQFFAGLIKAAVSRQREWLADASAVQFTRQTDGLVGALKKIAGVPAGSSLGDAAGAKQVSHMLFGEGAKRFSALTATHPPLEQRIAALDPTFRVEEFEQLRRQYAQQPPDGAAEDHALGFADGPPPPPVTRTARVDPATVAGRVGTLTPDDLVRGAGIDARIPADLRTAAGQVSTAVPLVLALLTDRDESMRARQLDTVGRRLGPAVAQAVTRLLPAAHALDTSLALPLAALATPQLAARPGAERDAVLATLTELALADGQVSAFEYSLTCVVRAYVADAADPARRSRPGRATTSAMRTAALVLLATVAAFGNADHAAAERAFRAATARLLPGEQVPYAPPIDPWHTLDAGWDALNALDPRNKQTLIEALVAAVADDGVVRVAEAELLRTTCAVLRCPLPPLVA